MELQLTWETIWSTNGFCFSVSTGSLTKAQVLYEQSQPQRLHPCICSVRPRLRYVAADKAEWHHVWIDLGFLAAGNSAEHPKILWFGLGCRERALELRWN